MNIKWMLGIVCCVSLMMLGLIVRKTESDADVLVVGTESAFPPFEMLDPSGNLIGFDSDVIQAVAQKMGKKVLFKIMSFDHLIMSLKQKKVDLIIAAISITKPRKAEIALVPYHIQTAGCSGLSFPLVFWKSIPQGIAKIEDLASLGTPMVSVQTGSVQKDIISLYPFLTVRQLDTIPDLIMDIKYGKSVACMLEPVVLESVKQKNPELVVVHVPLPSSWDNEGHGIGIRKDNTALLKRVEDAVHVLKNDGTLNNLEKKWLPVSPSL